MTIDFLLFLVDFEKKCSPFLYMLFLLFAKQTVKKSSSTTRKQKRAFYSCDNDKIIKKKFIVISSLPSLPYL